LQASNQVDSDGDGYGNVCDADYDNDNLVTVVDFATFLSRFGGPGDITDHDGDGVVTELDLRVFLSDFQGPPGPSGLG
jgi:hypothetical protein